MNGDTVLFDVSEVNEKLNKVRENTLKKIEGTQDNQNDYFLNSIEIKIKCF